MIPLLSSFLEKSHDVLEGKQERSVSFFKSFFLRNDKSIVYKREKRDWNVEIFDSFFEDMKNRGNINHREN